MRCRDLPPALAARSVGDPIDAITGELFDSVQDFRVNSAMPIEWHRTYSTARTQEDRGLGRGHSHSFDHRLKLDLDGIRYTSPLRVTVDFPAFHGGATRVARVGHVLKREGARLRLQRPDDDDLVFEVGRSPDARLVEVSGEEGSIHVSHDRDGRLASLIDVAGNVVSFVWQGRHVISARVLPRGASQHIQLAQYRYEGELLVEMEDAYKGRVNLAYDEAGRLIQRTDRNDYSFHFRYDADGRCVHCRGDDGVLEVDLEYLSLEYLTRVTKSGGGVWEYHHDAANNLTKIVAPDGVTRELVPRPEDGQVAIEIDGAGNEIAYEYNADGRCVGKRDSLGRPIRPERRHALPKNPLEYELGRFATIPIELPTLAVVEKSLPPAATASLVLAQAPGAGLIREVRDIQGLLIRQERDGRSKRYVYDQGGNLRWRIDFDGAKTEWAHASDDHRISKTDPNGFVTRLEYTRESELAAVTDAHHTRTVFARDRQGRLAGISRANVWKERYILDGAGRLIAKTGANGTPLFEVTRGPQGEVLEHRFASGGFERFEYDRDLRVVAAETAAARQSFSYDSQDRRLSDLRGGIGVYRRFADGELIEYRVLDSYVTRYRYLETPHSCEVVITDPTGREHRLRDHRVGVVTRELASGRRETIQYHPDGHCLGKVVDTATNAATASWTRRYDYSSEGYLLAKHDSSAGSTRYALDAAHRLVGEQLPTGQKRAYAHDAAGNLLDHAGRLATYQPGNVLSDAGVRRYEHDSRQAICTETWQGGFRRFHRDERDQLVRVESFRATSAGAWEPRPEWSARYDALNRRIEKTAGEQKTVFYWDTDRLAAELLPSGALRIYVYADALAMTPMLFVDYASADSAPASGVVYAVFADHLGCPERIEDMDGKTVWAATIAPYGAAQITIGAEFHQPLRWPGHYYDAELGLQYNRFRTYSPELGRYLEPDPLGRGGGLENVYAYTTNPLFRVDVDGLCPDGKPGDDEEKEAKATKPTAEEEAQAKQARMDALRAKQAAQRAQAKEDRRNARLDEAIGEADAKGFRDKLPPDQKGFVDESHDNARLAIDPDGNGGYRPSEAKAAQAAEEQGVLPGPVRRATKAADAGESGSDIVDGNGNLFDHKDSKMGADNIAKTANGKENVLVDCNNMSDADYNQLQTDTNSQLSPDAGQVKYVRRNDPF